MAGENRIGEILRIMRASPYVTATALSEKLEVSERTIRNDLKQLEGYLKDSAALKAEHGKYTLCVLIPDKFEELYEKITAAEDTLASQKNRLDYLFGRLMRAAEPLLTDDLAEEMHISRTTFVIDLKKLREALSEYSLKIIGRTNRGLLLEGSELDIRLYAQENCFVHLYAEDPLDADIRAAVKERFAEQDYEPRVCEMFCRSLTIMLDRLLNEHPLGTLPGKYYDLTLNSDFSFVMTLADRIAGLVACTIPLEERVFLLLPIIGMRTPNDDSIMNRIRLDRKIPQLLHRILDGIAEEMGIRLDTGELTNTFMYHLMFMLNRLSFSVRLDNPMVEQISEKYPLAFQLAYIAGQVIYEEYHLEVTEAELGYLASYFGVFLAENDIAQKKCRMAVVFGTEQISSRLVAAQLRRILDSATEIDTITLHKAEPDALEAYDIVLSTVPLPFKINRPVIRINEIFDERELLHKIEKAKYWDHIDVPILDNNLYITPALLDAERFFVLKDVQTYRDAVRYMAERLTENGEVDEGFWERLCQREEKSTMVFSRQLAIPHTVQTVSEQIVLAVGVLPAALTEKDYALRLIILIGLPEQMDEDNSLLIRIYDEIIGITRDAELLGRIASAADFRGLLHAFYKNAVL